MKLRAACVVVAFLSLVLSLTPLTAAQTAAQTASALPRLVRFGGAVKDLNGSPLTGEVGITFSLYSEQTGGAALWLETQNVTADNQGHYTALLGSTKPDGLPAELFTSEQARWVGVQVSGQTEQPRVLLVSAPYALKAGDAETIGGLPPSAFVLAAPVAIGSAAATGAAASTAESVSPATTSDVTTTGGTIDAIPLFSTATNIQNSILTQAGATAINVGGKLNLPPAGTATSSAGFNSRPQDFVASVFNSSTATAVPQTFQWQAEPLNNDKSTATGSLNLLYATGTATPAETGLKISNKGIFTFATGQAFPGTGDGTVTSVATGLGLKGGTIIKTGTLTIDTTVVPQLAAANTFKANQTVDGNLTATGTVKAATLSATNASISNSVVMNTANGGPLSVTSTVAGAEAIFGYASASTGEVNGVIGLVSSSDPAAYGVEGFATSSTGSPVGVYGTTNAAAGYGVSGSGATGVAGVSTSASGLGGNFTGWSAPSGSGFNGTDGVDGKGGNADPAGSSAGGNGVGGYGGTGPNDDGVGGFFAGGNSSGAGDGVYGYAGSGFAGYFVGNVDVNGAITATTKDFKIDHPLDPANKYLVHASVESSEMMNIYTGNITTDGQGHATVQLPEWFQVLNTDFRYQLTVIGQFAQAIVAHEIENNRFEIRTSAPNVKVSWQVTGVRQDAYAKAHPLVVEQEKGARLRGFYIHPELYGAPPEKQIEWARHPQMMKRIKEMQAKQQATVRAAAQPAAAQPK
ncbi:MAG: hypothetical protein ABSE40_02410 [Candidatus Sulfotelmatobacter sp.]|jgi:hypothetical protein